MAAIDDLINGVNSIQDTLNANNPLIGGDRPSGFNAPDAFSADGNGLPYTKVVSERDGMVKRNVVSWFVPNFGLVRMYVAPQSIQYAYNKIIKKEQTKGGFNVQYWGNNLTTLNIRGTTGSAGVEGINALYEVYQAEQLNFDSVGLTLAANNASGDISNNLTQASSNLVKSALGGGVAGSIIGGVLGLDNPINNLTPKNIPSLAQLAAGVELYHSGWVFRGFFESMTIDERAENFLLDYNIVFTVTQRRGARYNRFGWERSSNNGASNYDTPHSYNGKVIVR